MEKLANLNMGTRLPTLSVDQPQTIITELTQLYKADALTNTPLSGNSIVLSTLIVSNKIRHIFMSKIRRWKRLLLKLFDLSRIEAIEE